MPEPITNGTSSTPATTQVSSNSAVATQSQAQTQTPQTQTPQTTQTASPELEKLIQSAVDRATQKLGTENKSLRSKIEELQKKNMSAEELQAKAVEEKEKEIESREAALKDKENRWTALQEIKKVGLDDGSDTSLALVDFVLADDEAGIKAKVKTFNELVNKIVEGQVSKTFKEKGRTPASGTASNPQANETNIGTTIGKTVADTNKQSQKTLNHYLGGNK